MGKKTAAAEKDEQINRFVKKYNQIKQQLNKFAAFLSKLEGTTQLVELKVRTQKIEPLLNEFEEVLIEIELLDESQIDSEDTDAVEKLYYRCIAAAREYIERMEVIDRVSVVNTNLQQPNQSVSAKLPSLNLLKFGGDYSQFPQFFETFQTLVHKNNSLDNIQRFYYLIDSLEGEAKRVLECLEITNDNYLVALELLKKRFYNKPVIIQAHLKSLFDIPALNRESHQLLQGLVDSIEKHTRALKTLGEPVENWDRLIIFFISKKLDLDTKKEWEERSLKEFGGNPNLSKFTEFLENKARILSTVDYNSKGLKSTSTTGRVSEVRRGAHAAIDKRNYTNVKCEFCKGAHFVYFCEKLLGLPIEQRSEHVKKMRLCYNCLRSSHQVKDCRSIGCRKCRGRHNTMLHPENKSNSGDQSNNAALARVSANEIETVDENAIVATSCRTPSFPGQIILSTAIIEIKNSKNEYIRCRALLDSGSQVNLITRDLAKVLDLHSHKINMPISGINEMITKIDSQINSVIKSVHNNYTANVSFLILEKVTANIPSCSFDGSNLNIPSNLKLADPQFNISSQIDILLGAGIFYDLLCAGQIRLGRQSPILQKTVLGWVVSGPLYTTNVNKGKNKFSCHFVSQALQDQLEKFWAVEEFPMKKIYSREELECEKHFVETVKRDETGRFCVDLPLKPAVTSLGDSLVQAKNRLYSLENKFAKNPTLKQKYSEFIEEYSSLGHMSKVPDVEINTENNSFYLPHHAVLNNASTTTKLRVVFDASAKSTSGVSLNDVLKIGPTIQDELFEILIRFRQHEVVVTADIEKMYRQVNVVPQQRDLQRIVWRSDPSSEIEHFRLNTVTYGSASASFLATRCLKEVANRIQEESPELSGIISKCFYVDDFIFSTPSISEAIQIGQSLVDVLSEYGFPLRKWCSNKTEVLKALASEDNSMCSYVISDSDTVKTLGLFWGANHDTIEYTIKTKISLSSSVTKRLILSTISQIFDPLGLVGPVVIVAKIILQKLWQLQLGWDEAIPLELTTLWNNFYTHLDKLASIKIPRQCVISDVCHTEIHGFCDASESAYGACVYLRSVDAQGKVMVRLLCAKSRVAPLKSVSVPRLELNGALLLARLVNKVLDALDIMVQNIFLWTDSTIVLSWLANEPSSWKVYVANRVAEIQNLSKYEQWNHVISGDNPADIISRGVKPNQLNNLDLWWHGPMWLTKQQQDWPQSQIEKLSVIPEERNKKIILATATTVVDKTFFLLKNSLYQLTKLVGWCIRFYKNLKRNSRDRQHSKTLTVPELDEALIVLIKLAQNQEFAADILSLKQNGSVKNNSKLRSLDPFYKNDLILVGGRLRRSREPYWVKHPIVLPKGHPLTRLIIADQHQKQLHAGSQAILASLRERFWIINGKREVRSVLSKCRVCFRVNPISLNQKMGNFPRDRTVPQRPFAICGIDYAGPFSIKDGKLRNRAIVKGYMCLFICFVTKAVHIELVGDLSSDAFLNCLKRFVSRRGLCKRIYTDNATNFVGANNKLRELTEVLDKVQKGKAVQTYSLENKIEWHFIPPRSPHQGGLWEAAIKSAKYHIIRVVGDKIFTFEDLSTVFSQVESVLNSRPLTPLSSDPNDLQVLTPGHFLIGESLNALPQADVTSSPCNRLKHYHVLQQIVQHLWKRWSLEYLTTLQERSKWRSSVPNLEIGTLVVLKDENSVPLNWRLGRVVAVHPGTDEIVRVASVRTASGIVKRAVQKLCVLPIESDSENNKGIN